MSGIGEDFIEYTPELGDTLTLISPKFGRFGRLTGTIIFRDATTLRIQRKDASDLAQDILMGTDGDFAKEEQIAKLILHSKRTDPHFVVQQCIFPGDNLEYQDNERNIIGQGIVNMTVVNETEDRIIMNDGTEIDFAFIGPPAPIYIINRVPAEDIPQEETVENVPESAKITLELPVATVTEIPTAERTYTEEVQRDEMYRDLLKDLTEKQQTNPVLIKRAERETEVLLALKKAVTSISEDGFIIPFTRTANSLKDVLEQYKTPLSSIVPVLDIKRILYTEEFDSKNPSDNILQQVDIRNWLLSELHAINTSNIYNSGEGGADRAGKQMYTYLYNLLYLDGSVYTSNTSDNNVNIVAEQDVYRTVVPPQKNLGFSKIGPKAVPTIKNIGKISGSQQRVIGSLKTTTGEIIAPGDPGSALAYLLLPTNIGATFRPVKNSGVLVEDIRAANFAAELNSLDYLINNPTSYNHNGIRVIKNKDNIDGEEASQINVSEWMEYNFEKNVHPSDRMNVGSVGINRVLDSIGLRSYEWTPEISEVIWASLKKSQNQYIQAFNSYKEKVENYLKTAPPYKNSSAIDETSKIYINSKNQKEIFEQLEFLASYDITNGNFDLAQAQHLLSVAEGTLAYVLYKSVDEESDINLAEAIQIYKSELYRYNLFLEKHNTRFAHLSSQPEINNCPHVKTLDKLRSVLMKDEGEFYNKLHGFLEQYEGGRDDNWVSCSKCNKHLICIHEIMKFREKTHPGRGQALGKEVIINFGGAAFNGRYVCKNCGIPIAEFEYDNHLEFDDKGKPLIGRNVLEEVEKTVDDELDTLLDISAKKALLFEADEKQKIYDALRTIVLNAGFDFNEEQYKRIVDFTDNVIKGLPSETQYMAGPKAKGKPAYDVFCDSYRVALLTVMILCEIHSMDPLPEVLFPFGDCRFNRGGFPIETDIEGPGAQEYMVCIVANLFRDINILNNTVWYPDVESKSRQKTFAKYLKVVFDKPDVRSILLKTREIYNGIIKKHNDTISSQDRIPSSFRPVVFKNEPVFTQLQPFIPDLFLNSVSSMPIQSVKPEVEIRAYQYAVDEILSAHTMASQTGLLNKASPRSDSNCCFMSLQDVKNKGMISSVQPDLVETIQQSEHILHSRDPTEQRNGTHFWVHWSPPKPVVGIPVKPDASYFKMFMRTCASGSRIGENHEFGRRHNSYVCRHCKFTVQENPLILMSDLADAEMTLSNPKASGKAKKIATDIYSSIVLQVENAIAEKGIRLDNTAFENLLNVVNKNRKVDSYISVKSEDPFIIFNKLSDLVKNTPPIFLHRLDDWNILENIIAEHSKMVVEPSIEERVMLWSTFAERYDILKMAIIPTLDNKTKGGKKTKSVTDILASIEALFEDPIRQGPSEMNKNWIVGFERLAKQFSEMIYDTSTWFGHGHLSGKITRNFLFSGTKWFGKKISEQHRKKIEAMIEKMMATNATTNKRLSEPSLRPIIVTALQKIALWLGNICSFWVDNIASMKIIGVTVDEIRYILKWLLLVCLESILSIQSPIYAEVGTPDDKNIIVRELSEWVCTTANESNEDFKHFGLSDEQIKMLLLDAIEKEKISVIKEMDDEKDADLRELAKINKKFGLGRWAIGSKIKGNTYNAEVWDFLQEQKARAGAADPLAVVATDFGQMAPEAPSAYDYRAEEHEDEGGGE